jgi:predicted nucleic acid-binding protein
MKVLFDTNILVDVALARKPFAKASLECWTRSIEFGELPFVAPHSLATFYYLVENVHGADRARLAVEDLLETGHVVEFGHADAVGSLELACKDFEDAMIVSAAVRAEVEAIITRNEKDFCGSPIPVFTPEDYLKVLRVEPGHSCPE